MTTIAVTGATGQLARLALADLALRAPDARLLALARDPCRLTGSGAEPRAADYADPASLAPALEGVDVLVLVSSNSLTDRVSHHANVIAAAQAAGVGRLI